jgi:hypothetical protein
MGLYFKCRVAPDGVGVPEIPELSMSGFAAGALPRFCAQQTKRRGRISPAAPQLLNSLVQG